MENEGGSEEKAKCDLLAVDLKVPLETHEEEDENGDEETNEFDGTENDVSFRHAEARYVVVKFE